MWRRLSTCTTARALTSTAPRKGLPFSLPSTSAAQARAADESRAAVDASSLKRRRPMPMWEPRLFPLQGCELGQTNYVTHPLQ